MSLPKHDLRIYLDAETKAELDAYAEAMGVEDGKAAAEIITEALGKNHKHKVQAARLVRAGLVRIGRD